MKRFLVIQTAFLGDVILATPLAFELKRLFPDSQIDFLVKKGNESLLENSPYIHRVYTFDKKQGKFSSMRMLIKEFRLNHYAEIINLHRFASSGIIASFSKPKAITGFSKNPLSFLYTRKIAHEIGNGKHEVERNLECIRHLGAQSKLKPQLFPTLQQELNVQEYVVDSYFCLAPASVWFTKQLPEFKWVELANQLVSKGLVYLVGGPNDWDLCERIRLEINNPKVLNLAGKFQILESAALLGKASMNYVNDSGPLHICSAMNAPVTAFFCSTVPGFGFGPLSDDSKVIETTHHLACRPCGLHGFKSCPKQHFTCGNSIKIDLV